MHRIKKVQIETIRGCNGRCLICNYRDNKAVFSPLMGDDVFLKIAKQIRHLPNLETVCPYNHNEPLLDRNIFEKIKIIKSLLPDIKIELSTNGLLLNRGNFRKFCSSVDDKWISFHGVDAPSYWRIMGLPWSNAQKLREMIAWSDAQFSISVGLTSEYTEDDIKEFWKDYDNVKLMIFKPRSRCGNIKSTEVESHYKIPTMDFDCWRFNLILVYNTEGQLLPCSNDLQNEGAYADYTDTLEEIMIQRERFRELNQVGGETICWECGDHRGLRDAPNKANQADCGK